MDESAPKRRRVPSEAAGPRRARPSFASPTKASLSRHNPDILEKRRSASPAKPPPAPASDAGSDQSLSGMLSARPGAAAHVAAASEPDRGDDAPRRGEGRTSSRMQPAGRVEGGLAAAPRRSPAIPQPRPLPPPAPEGEDDLNPFIGHTLRRSPNTGVSIPPPPEPELPPAVPDPVSSTLPRGIHSSPSRWREKRRASKKSSPLKPPPQRPQVEPGKKPEKTSRGRKRTTPRSQEPTVDIALDPTTDHARRVAAPDTNAAKLKEREALREEIALLQSDLKTASEENERLRLMQTSGRIVASNNEDGVVDLLHRRLIPQEEEPQSALSYQLTQAALNPMGLLPFGRPSMAAALPVSTSEGDQESIQSHHPVSMTTEQELPYLELFSQLSVTSDVAVLAAQPNQPLRQRRLVTLRSRDVPGLFTAKLEMVVNAMNLSIVELAVTALEPAAKYELEPFAAKICSGSCNRTMQRNIGVLAWAMGEWYRVATLRAQFWSRLDQRFGTSERVLESATEAWEAPRRRQREDSAEPDASAKQKACSKVDLLRFLGQQSFEIEVPIAAGLDDTAQLRLEWKITFDWTGEAQSKVAVLVGLPGHWHEADERGVFSKLPTLFHDLVTGGQEPEDAVRTIAALLAGGPLP